MITRQQEARELISQWVMDGKELEEIEKELQASRLAGALSPAAITNEYYTARTARKVARPPILAKKTARFVGVLALLAGSAALMLPLYLDKLAGASRLPLTLLGLAALLAGLILIITPARAFER